MRHRITLQDAQFRRLREAYEAAFRELSLRVRRFQALTSDGAPDSEAVTESLRRVEEALSVYRESRNLLAAFVMAAPPEAAVDPSSAVFPVARTPNEETGTQAGGSENEDCPDPRAQVEHLAYLLWEQADRPTGDAEEHWRRAEQLILKRP